MARQEQAIGRWAVSQKTEQLRRIIEVGRACYEAGLVSGKAGNISARMYPGEGRPEVLVTGTGTRLGDLSAQQIVEVIVNPELDYVPASTVINQLAPTSELPMHLSVYSMFADINAIVHTHSPAASAFACARRELPTLAREAEVLLGSVPLVPLRPEGSKELGHVVVEALQSARNTDTNRGGAALLERHGVVCWADSLTEALSVAELVEHTACIALFYHQIH